MPEPYLHPILSCEQAMRFERAVLQGDACEWQAMCRAGTAVALAMLGDWRELCGTGWYWNGLYGGVACSDWLPAGTACASRRHTNADWHRHQSLAAGVASGSSCGIGMEGQAAAGPRVLVLVGKGHNGGDALLAAAEIGRRFTQSEIILYRTQPLDALRPLCRRAWDALFALAAERTGLQLHDASAEAPQMLFSAGSAPYAFCIDGLLGMQSRPPLRGREAAVLGVVNAAGARIGLRAAVDLPSGLGDPGAFCADFTYATGIAKHPVFQSANSVYVGRLRYLDIGFFANTAGVGAVPYSGAASGGAVASADDAEATGPLNTVADGACGSDLSALTEVCAVRERVITAAVLDTFRNWRSPFKDKRHYGHLFVLAGSTQMPGALLMNVQAALRSGAGLVTAFAPQSVAHVFAAQAPEAMWIPWPETEEGTLALEGQYLLAERMNRATALLMGSGMGRSAETLALLEDIARTCDVPLVLDADALLPSVLAAAARHPRHGVRDEWAEATAKASGASGVARPAAINGGGNRPVLITPHAGEFMRLCPLAPVPRRYTHDPAVPAAWAPDAAGRSAGSSHPADPAVGQCDSRYVDMNDIDWADALRTFCREHGLTTILKGVQTRVADADRVSYGLFGGPVLARGGSGDVLAGLVGGCLVQHPTEPLLAAQQAVCWHGLASQSLARERGQACVTTMELVEHLQGVIRSPLYC